MRKLRHQALGPLLAGEGSRAFLGLEIVNESKARPVVLIWVPQEANQDSRLLGRIRRETEHAATLEHPNILRVLRFACLEEGYARVVEFADGESVRRILEVTRILPPRFAAKLAADAAMGVHYAHVAGNDDGQPLLHGDIRPETLIVSFAGVCKVSGYGALNVVPSDPSGARVLRRRLHCAPEQVIGGREALVPQTDVYLLGLTLYECLTGKVPFESAEDLDQAILAGVAPPIEDPDVPTALKEVVSRAIAKKAPERFATPLAFKEAIEAAMQPLPTSEELAAYLQDFFPQAEDARAARRREIDAGIAEFARNQWALVPSGKSQVSGVGPPPPRTPPPPPPPDELEPAPATPPVARRPAAVPAPPEEEETTLREDRRSRAGVVGIVIALVAVVAGTLVWARAGGGEPTGSERVPAPPPVIIVDAGPFDAGSVAQAVTVEDAGAELAEVPIAPLPPPEEPTWLELNVEPAVELVVDGKPAGRSPYRQKLPAGRHVVKLVDKAKGISTSRSVVVRAKGTTSEEITLGRGSVSVSAPEGAVIYIDGKRVGYAPIKDLSLWEGGHRIQVTVGKAKWQQAFTTRPNERQYFNVETQ